MRQEMQKLEKPVSRCFSFLVQKELLELVNCGRSNPVWGSFWLFELLGEAKAPKATPNWA
jgi:hypothetical protein